MDEIRTCTKCNEEKPLEDFPQRDGSPQGRSPSCRLCQSERQREYYKVKMEKKRLEK